MKKSQEEKSRFEEKFADFFDLCQKLITEHYRNYSWNEKLEWKDGRKYRKINMMKEDGTGVHVWAFINKENGDILKPAGWKAPDTKNNRGNIFDDDPMLFINWTGPAYMDQIRKYYGS